MSRKDAVSPELHAEVVRRDGSCIAARMDDSHECATRFNEPHRADEDILLTVDHVWWNAGGIRSKRAPSIREHLVAMCGRLNVRGPSREVRQAERSLLRKLYPSHGTPTGCVCLRRL